MKKIHIIYNFKKVMYKLLGYIDPDAGVPDNPGVPG